MTIDLDKIVAEATRWELSLTIDGVGVATTRPGKVFWEAMAEARREGATPVQITDAIRRAMASVVDAAVSDPRAWRGEVLVAALVAVLDHRKRNAPKFHRVAAAAMAEAEAEEKRSAIPII
jgi:hypothetical protein